jgi:membrane fusion protein (multidrug efflux system)
MAGSTDDGNESEQSSRDSRDPAKRDDRDDGRRGEHGGDGKPEGEDESEEAGEDEDDGKPPLYKRPIFWIVVGIVAAVLIVGGVLYYLHSRKYQSTDDAFVDAHVVRIAAETTGRLSQVVELDNQQVRAGQILAVIEPGTPSTSLREAQAGVAESEAGIAQAQAQVGVALASLQQAQANARVPLAEAGRAQADYARYLDLKRIDASAVAPTQLDQARAQAQAAEAQAAAARKQVDTAAANLGSARKQVDAAQAQRKAAQARVQQAQVTVSYTTIRAPIDGQLVQRQVNVGSYVAPGQQLMAIVPNDMWVTANFKETQLALMKPGLPVEIKIDAFPDETFPGHVDSIQRGAGQAFQLLPPQNATGNYVKVVQRVPVRIRFDGTRWRKFPIGPGMSAEPTVKVRP